ncbi:MAG: hypothetical protein COA50_05175 [Flavobacteriaceae bacterium]|nr:MAG: hypothetical protein COA50_05175 [Flavobacteriaceae bacterium]
MKKKALLFGILIAIAGTLYGIKKGMLTAPTTEYVDLNIPEFIDYNFNIKPILSDKCYTCHGPDANKRKAGLRLDIEESVFSELPENPGKYAIVAQKPGKSILYQRIIAEEESIIMPPIESNLKLNIYEKKIIKKWIEQGGKFEKHWAYISPQKAENTPTSSLKWGNNEIDAFVLLKLEENNLVPSKKAKIETLIRRMSLDLTGLPPKHEQVEKWLANSSEVSLEEVIDVYLASPAYGERMAQVWLDVARYADSHGYQDDSYRSMWPWRDWVIHAFNKNLPYNQFLIWQLAGDLLPNATKEQILATGFNRNHPITQEGGVIQEEYRSYYVVDRTNTLGKGILGLTLECAKCHDHKYDALSQKNYFEFYSFFNQVNEKGLQMDAVQAKNQSYFADAPYMLITDEETEGVLSFINKKSKDYVNVMIMNDSAPKTTFIFNRGEYDAPTDSVQPNTPDYIFPFSEDLDKNRLGLAKWVTDKSNPLTARVFVNRIWAMLFGNGLVVTSEDFGVQGSLPTHPKLLDWLARDFMDHDWDIKYLLKKIMLSATYQQSSEVTEELLKIDSENRFLARATRFRMSGEMIRDYMLATSGLLNTEIGGPSVKPYQPPGLWAETTAGDGRGILSKYVQDVGDNLYRRSLYTFWKRTSPPPNMTIFDAPTRDNCEVRRQKTNTPLQALALQNDVQVLEAARVLAQNMVINSTNDSQMLNKLFQRILIRDPAPEEFLIVENYYADALNGFIKEKDKAEQLLNQGEYEKLASDPAKTAALMLTTQVLFNLDETITKE